MVGPGGAGGGQAVLHGRGGAHWLAAQQEMTGDDSVQGDIYTLNIRVIYIFCVIVCIGVTNVTAVGHATRASDLRLV